MKRILFGILPIIIGFQPVLIGQTEKEIKSKIIQVTVYPKGAQIEREANFELQQGKQQLIFKNLSPYINKESIRVDGDGKFTILNVQLQNDFVNQLEKNKEVADLNTRMQLFKDKMEEEQTAIKILNEKLEFLKSNKEVLGEKQSVSPEVFRSFNQMYGENFEKYSMEILKRQRIIRDYTKEVEKLQNQLNSLNSKNELPAGTITIVVVSKQSQTSTLKLSYVEENASWYPSYDIRFLNTNKPLSISFKANISQNTGVDWKEVALKLSTTKTNISAQIPVLYANYLQYYVPTVYYESEKKMELKGAVTNTIAPSASSDIKIRGAASLKSNNPLYIVDGQPREDISSMDPNDIDKMEVLNDASSTSIYGSRGANGVVLITTKSQEDKSGVPLTVNSKNETSNEYIVDALQTVNSDNKLNTITFKETTLNATYEYQSIPKLSKNVYLIAKISDWFKADLIDGETNIYLENSFVGKSRINTQQFSDTLDISFGVDNNITVNRDKIKDFSESQFLGSSKKQTFAWKLTIRNNKTYPIKAKLYDQVPVSSIKDIQVETLELSGGSMNPNTGKVQWTIELKPNETKQVILKYSVKFPKDKTVVVD